LRVPQKSEVEILSLLKTPDPKNISLTLGLKSDTTFKLTMIIGEYEAQSLAVILKGLKARAPLPLDLLEDAIKKFGYRVQEVVIDSLKTDFYTAKIICYSGEKKVELKARPVDAVAIASKFNSPIFVNTAFLTR
jgi:bifunctional DNase/RNase